MNTIDIKTLVPQLQKQVKLLTEDLIDQAKTVEAAGVFLRTEYRKAVEAEALSQTFEEWSDDVLEQIAVSWVLSCVFVRFLEDNYLIDECWIAGEGSRGKLADGHHEIYFRSYPHHSDREYLKYVFKEVGKIPAAEELFDAKTLLWSVDPSADAARVLFLFFKEIDAERGGLKRPFDTREAVQPLLVDNGVRTEKLAEIVGRLAPQAQFLGDVYQDLSEHARKKYALLQTPEFVQQFILDRTLTPAIAEFGLKGLRVIDPACGSGHFLLGAFDRLFELWMKSGEVRDNPVIAVQNAFDSLFGVDINPFAIAITRFRMLVAAVRACGINRLHQQSYAWKLNLAVGDSLLRGSRPTSGNMRERIVTQQRIEFEEVPKLPVDDPAKANDILDQSFHVVVGNPPYITPKDKSKNGKYREVYSTCHRQYSLGVPFTQRFWDLAIRKGEPVRADAEAVSPDPGRIGMITANSFMKREFGKKLIEEFFPKSDLTHVIDTSGAYIPGHGTPTVILFGRHRKPAVGEMVRAVLGIKGEPATPDEPAEGLVWRSILRQLDRVGAQDEFTSTADVARETFAAHPWSIGGGGSAELKEELEARCSATVASVTSSTGFYQDTHADDVFVQSADFVARHDLRKAFRWQVRGDEVRDWVETADEMILFPYGPDLNQWSKFDLEDRWTWLYCQKTVLWARGTFGGSTYRTEGRLWYDYHQFPKDRARSQRLIAFAEVATHNHFVLDRGGKVFNRTAPVIKLPTGATEDDHLALLGLLNCSTGCFWLKQACFDKGNGGIGGGIGDEKWERRSQFAGTAISPFPIPDTKPLKVTHRIDHFARGLGQLTPSAIIANWLSGEPLAEQLEIAEAATASVRRLMIALQEELDWECYRHYGLLAADLNHAGGDPPDVNLGERAFEIVMARQMAAGELQTAWFDRHGSTPVTAVPNRWPEAYRTLVERRIRLIETNKEIGLIEKPEYKRRWNTEPWADQQERALLHWLLDRVESPAYWPAVEFQSTARLADRASADADFLQVASVYRGRQDFDVAALVAELVGAEAVPFLPVLRYKVTGLRKRVVWERTWDLQRQEDAGVNVGDIPVPPKYESKDFLKTDFWRLRGKLDVPKERWVSYPHCSTDADPSLLVGWAGWDHLQQAEALTGYYDARKRDGWGADRLAPVLAGLDQLLPWIRQWHPDVDPEYGETAGQSYQTLLEQDARELGLSVEDVRNWQPPVTAPRRKSRK